MRKYTVIAVLTLQAGTLVGLSDAQASGRRHALKQARHDKKAGMGEYEVLSPIQFKVGETIYTDATLNKQQATYLEPVEQTRAKEQDAAEAAARAKDLALLKDKAEKWDAAQADLDALRAKADSVAAVQEELDALRRFVAEIEALPTELLEQVKAAVEKARASAEKAKK